MTRSRFHLAFHVTDLNAARAFYGDILGCAEGRSTESWVDFDFFGHQISLHLGIILPKAEWDALAQKLKDAQTVFVIEPTTRFAGEPGEQSIMFFTDPSGNPIEVKGFKDFDGIFAS
jgi:extradiol dioxygenase family protein